VPAAEVRKHLITNFPVCNDLEAYHRIRALDIVHEVEPTLIFTDKGGAATTARAHHGLEVHRLDNGRMHVTYAPRHAPYPLPMGFQSFFEKDKIATIDFVPANQNPPPEAVCLHELPHDPSRRAYLGFTPIDKVAAEVSAFPNVAQSLRHHRQPEFSTAAAQITMPPAKPSLGSQFRQCMRTLVHYGRLGSPFVDASDPQDWRASALALTAGVLAENDVFGRIFEVAAPWAFALSAALLTRRMAANALTVRTRKNLNVATQGLLTAGPALFIATLAPEAWRAVAENGAQALNQETVENLGGLVTAALATRTYLIGTFRALRNARPGG
jgi:hypothetical protein